LEGKPHRTAVEEVNSFKRGRQDFWNVELIVSRLLGAGNMTVAGSNARLTGKRFARWEIGGIL